MSLIICDRCGHDMSKHGRLDFSTGILMIKPCENCLMECDKEGEELVSQLEGTIEKLKNKIKINDENEEERKGEEEEFLIRNNEFIKETLRLKTRMRAIEEFLIKEE